MKAKIKIQSFFFNENISTIALSLEKHMGREELHLIKKTLAFM